MIITIILQPPSTNAQQVLDRGENVPIAFYGKVMDQEGQPVPDAKVSIRLVITHYAENRGGQKDMVAETDQNGEFSLKGETGHVS